MQLKITFKNFNFTIFFEWQSFFQRNEIGEGAGCAQLCHLFEKYDNKTIIIKRYASHIICPLNTGMILNLSMRKCLKIRQVIYNS